MITQERYNRYKSKISICYSRLGYIDEWGLIDWDVKTRFASYKVIQEIVERLSDIISMILRDSDKTVSDDYSNFRIIKQMGLITDGKMLTLNEANGLRNRLVHEYNGINDSLIEKSFSRIKPEIETILEDLELWIKNNLK